MTHFLSLADLQPDQLKSLIQLALELKQEKHRPAFPKFTLANLFYENSTRTRISFEMAAKRLSMQVVHVDIQNSSESKGEQIKDTLLNLSAMGITHFAIRHSEEGLIHQLASELPESVHLINAGDGKNEHPSQGLLDLMTILEAKSQLKHLKIVILGDILHSRVAKSLGHGFSLLGVKDLTYIAPRAWQPQGVAHGTVTDQVEEGLTQADVIITLRVQRERLLAHEQLSLEDYQKHFTLDKQRLSLAKKDAIVMHPGPMNRGIEITHEVADGPQSQILNQVTNGVFARMAILNALMPAQPSNIKD